MAPHQFPAHCSLCNVNHVSFSQWQLMCVWLVGLEPSAIRHDVLYWGAPAAPTTSTTSTTTTAPSHAPVPSACSISHSHSHTLRLWFQLGFFSLKTHWNLTGFDREGFRADPATVTDIRQLDDNCCLIAETQVSLMADDNRQLWVMDGFDEKLQSWNKKESVCAGTKTR